MNEFLKYFIHGVLELFGVVAEKDDSAEWQQLVTVVFVVVSLIFAAVMIWLYWPW